MDPKVIERSIYGVVGFVVLAAFMYTYQPSEPQSVWVPGDDFKTELTVSIVSPKEAYSVGEWIELYAEQESSPWVEVAFSARPPGVTYWTSPPPSVDADVQGSVRWVATPDAASEFNLPTMNDLDSRRVRFNEPGTYTLHAEVSDPQDNTAEPVMSNVLTVEVTE